jgi:hypothetical protein
MCGGGGWNPLRNIAETVGSLAGNFFLPGSSLLTDQLVSTGSQQQLGSPLGELGQVASALAGSGIGSDTTGIPQSAGGALESAALSNFANYTGLSSLFGGTPQPAVDFQSDFNLANAPSAGGVAADQASSPTLGQTILGGGGVGGAPSISSGGSTLAGGGIPDANIGESITAPSASGFGSGIDFSGANPTGISNQFSLPGTDSVLGGAAPISPTSGEALSSYTPMPQAPNLQGIISGTGGNDMGTMNGLTSLIGGGSQGGGAGANVLNGLLRGGLGYLLNNPNNQGKNAIEQATGEGIAAEQPYLQTGNAAENTLANLYGNNGTAAQTAAQQNFTNTPGYQFALNQGLNAVNANAAAMGSPLSGNNQEAINNYAQGAASQNYNNYVNQLQNMAGGGANAASSIGNLAMTGAGGVAGVGQNNANNQNAAIGQALNGLFPTGLTLQQLLGGGGNNNGGGLLSLLGV